ncbi:MULTISPECIES: esterase/lipase family protein [unclassified Rhodococcus (in: high G+C Gram-positive bacteria)]|uniref:esterase/lipase family protein n=1 Tax=unclassified Rhodococcus (in: high G+C Gram-positive bacteria) TaxID=192944 RepID=UPI00146C2DC9|nr:MULTISPECIES: alpha/beta fold hydrolase [unclassified Rhodococcus (in: high G+C Gram-positive bacteria)]MBF0662550.1 lipase [Rhodococcus sp. (in: high G+C Gram-positive bacteria)]NMD96534.1 lipase [Rhodococcus sp. BL-253-APC-6A1W]NME79327.1 lipase [Rhodococcus sp. 105337]
MVVRRVWSAGLAALCVAAFTAGVAGAQPLVGVTGSSSSVPVVPGPPAVTHAEAAEYAENNPGAVPPQTNDFSCVLSPENPRPVVLAHGTDSNSYSDFAALTPLLAASGRCVFAVNYGLAAGAESYGTGEIRVSAAQFGEFVERVRAETGATEVDVVGYSQGAVVTRYYINKLGGAHVVDRWVGVASPSYGGTFYGLATAIAALPGATDFLEGEFSVALAEQLQGSVLLTELNAPSDTVPGVQYTTIGTRFDEVIQPADNVALRGEGAVNLVVQDLCPQNRTGHFNMVYDEFTLQLIRHALDPDRVALGTCTRVALGTGIPEVVRQANF